MPSVFGVRPAAISRSVASITCARLCIFDIHANLLAGSSLDSRDGGIQQHLDALVAKQFEKRSPDIGILSARELRTSLDHRDARAKTANGLRQFEADIAAADDDKVSRDALEIERLNVGHGRSLDQTWHVGVGCASAEAQDHTICGDDSFAAAR